MHTNVYCSISYSSQEMEAAKCALMHEMDKEDAVYIYTGILLSHKKRNLAIVTTWMDLEGIS